MGPRPRKTPALIRLLIALAALGLFVYAYLSGGLASNEVLAPLLKGQFSPALYRAGAALIPILALTLIFGRLYCSVLCPLGTLQEIFWRLGKLFRGGTLTAGGRRNFKRAPPLAPAPSRPADGPGLTPPPPAGAPPPQRPRRGFKMLGPPGIVRTGYAAPPRFRYLIPFLSGLGLALSIYPLVMLFDPISGFGRGMAALRNGGLFALILAVPTALILLAALFRGRAFCAYCPVGITLGLFSSAAPLGMKRSPRCASCGLCEKKCPSGCIDPRQKKLDSERCVLCFSCAAACPSGALSYGLRWGKTAADESRRVFLKGAGKLSLLCGAAYLLGPGLKRFAPPARGGGNVSRPLPILPPGAKSLDHYRARCSGCQACAAACPAGIIKPRAPLPLPRLDYTDAGCQFNCVECGKVCPTGAISPLSLEEKKLTRIALSSLRFEHCVVNTNHESCGACAEVCPTGAVTMVPYDEPGIPYLTRPVLDDRYCIGCGACLAACPARPKALLVEAVEKQTRTIGPRPEEESGDELRIEITEDFPF